MQKISEIFLPLPRNRKKTEIDSLSYDVNEHVYSKSKSVQLRSYLKVQAKIRLIRLTPCQNPSNFKID